MKLGKKTVQAFRPNLSALVSSTLPQAPSSVDYYSRITNWPVMDNDDMADCTIAAVGHMIQEWTAKVKGVATVVSDTDIQAIYWLFVGNGVTDQDVKLTDVLDYWQNTGFTITGVGVDKIVGYMLLASKSQSQTQSAIYFLGNCYIGLTLPDEVLTSLVNQAGYNQYGPDSTGKPHYGRPWDDVAANYKPNPSNGHCVPAVGYDANNLYVVTWGALIKMSWKFYFAFMDEAYAVLSPDWVQTAPPFDLPSLMNVLSNIAPPTRNDIKMLVLQVLNSILAQTGRIFSWGNGVLPDTTSVESLALGKTGNDCLSFSSQEITNLSSQLTGISMNPHYQNPLPVTLGDATLLKTVGDAITVTWNRAKGFATSPVPVAKK